jgi:hypothetical protein
MTEAIISRPQSAPIGSPDQAEMQWICRSTVNRCGPLMIGLDVGTTGVKADPFDPPLAAAVLSGTWGKAALGLELAAAAQACPLSTPRSGRAELVHLPQPVARQARFSRRAQAIEPEGTQTPVYDAQPTAYQRLAGGLEA